MKSERNILVAFLLNLLFSVIEFIGGLMTNSIAIMSDSVHDIGDSISIGLSYFLELKSKKKPDNNYTYGYVRYSVLGSLITILILIIGSVFVIYNGILRLFNPVDVNYDGMIIFALIGVIVNFLAVYVTRDGKSLNQKSVNLHMLEDVLGWILVLIGAIVMRFTNIKIIDPILSILVSLFIFVNAFKTLKEIVYLFLDKVPSNINIEEIKKHLLEIKGVQDVHHIHVRSIDGFNNYATMHVVVNGYSKEVKDKVKRELSEHGIVHTTIEFEEMCEDCDCVECEVREVENHHHHHHHH